MLVGSLESNSKLAFACIVKKYRLVSRFPITALHLMATPCEWSFFILRTKTIAIQKNHKSLLFLRIIFFLGHTVTVRSLYSNIFCASVLTFLQNLVNSSFLSSDTIQPSVEPCMLLQ
jgi:hypothetical protein